MAIFDAPALQRLADMLEREFLTEDCTILRQNKVQRTSGGMDTTYIPLTPTVKSAVLDAGTPARNPQQVFVADKPGGVIVKLILLPRGTDVQGTDRLTVAGTTYEVIDLFEPTTYEVVRRVLVRRSSI